MKTKGIVIYSNINEKFFRLQKKIYLVISFIGWGGFLLSGLLYLFWQSSIVIILIMGSFIIAGAFLICYFVRHEGYFIVYEKGIEAFCTKGDYNSGTGWAIGHKFIPFEDIQKVVNNKILKNIYQKDETSLITQHPNLHRYYKVIVFKKPKNGFCHFPRVGHKDVEQVLIGKFKEYPHIQVYND